MKPDKNPQPAAPEKIMPKPPEPEAAGQRPIPRRKRRWRRLLVGVVLLVALLALLVGLAPTFASTRWGTALLLPLVNDRIQGTAAVEKLSLSWFGDCEVRGLRVTDPVDQEVLHLARVAFTGGLWKAITSWQAFGSLLIEAPRAVFYIAEDGRISLVEAFGPKVPTTQQEAGKFVFPDGGISLEGGRIKIVRFDGLTYEVSQIDVRLDLASSGRLKADFSADLQDGGRLAGEVSVEELMARGEFQPSAARGTVKLVTQKPIDIESLSRFAVSNGHLAGRLSMDLDCTLQPGGGEGAFSARVDGLASSRVGPMEVKPVDVRMSGRVRSGSGAVTGTVDVEGDPGTLGAQFSYALGPEVKPLAWGDVVSAALAGEPVELPQLTLDATGRVDLAALARAVPALLKLRADTEITAGRLDLTGAAIRGGAEPSATVEIALTGLTGITAGRPVSWAPITAALDLASQAGAGLQIRRAELRSGFGHAVASGTPSSLHAQVEGDLGPLYQQLGQIVDLKLDELAGHVSATVDASRAGEDRVDLAVALTAKDLRYRAGEKVLDIRQGALNHEGFLTLEDGGLRKVETTQTRVDLDGRVQAAANGWFDLRQQSFNGDLTVEQGDLAYIARQAALWGIDALESWSGQLQLHATLARDAADAPIVYDGTLAAHEIAMDREVLATTANARLNGRLDGDAGDVNGNVEVDGEPANLRADFQFPWGGDAAATPWSDLISAAIAGEPVELPVLSVDAEGRLNLAALAGAFPALVKLRPDTQVTAGSLELSQVKLRGGARPSAGGDIRLAGLTAITGGKRVSAEPITAKFDLASEPGRGVQIRHAELRSGFGHATASGTPSSLHAQVEGDLGPLYQQLGQIVDLKLDELAGHVSATVDASRAGEDRVNLGVALAAKDLRYRAGEKTLDVRQGELNHQGVLTLQDGGVRKIETSRTRVDLDGRVQADASGWIDLREQSFNGDLRVEQGDLAYLAQQAAVWGVDALESMTGRVQLQAKIGRSAAGKPILCEGTLAAKDVAIDRETVAAAADARWSGIEIEPDAQRVRLKSVGLKSDAAEFNVSGFEGRFGEDLSINGNIQGQGDLTQCAALAARLGKAELPPLAGQFSINTRFRSSSSATSVAGNGEIKRLLIGRDSKQPPEDVRFAYDADIQPQAKTIAVKDLNLASAPLTVQVSGQVRNYATDRSLDLDGTYELRWERLIELLEALQPSAAGQFVVRGTEKGTLSLKGPVSGSKQPPGFRNLKASTTTGWASAEMYGVSLGRLSLSPALEGGSLQVPTATAPAGAGKANLGGSVDFREDVPTLRLPPRLTLLEGVEVTPELAKQLLSRFNPVFAHVTRAEGKLDLLTNKVVLPLGEALNTGGSGSGRLDLQDFKVQPGGLLAKLLEFGGKVKPGMHEIQVSGLDFVIKEGRIHYKDFTMRFGESQFDLKFYGSVGFDDTVDLVVSVPVQENVLKHLNLVGPKGEYAKLLAGMRVDIPIAGTRENPRLDFSKVDTRQLLEKIMQGTGKGILEGKGLDDLFDLIPKKEPKKKDRK